MQLDYVTIFLSVRLKCRLPDPYLLFSGRSRFQRAFREACGCRRGDCCGCAATGECPYSATFGQAVSSDPEAVRRHQKPPLPFVFRFPAPLQRADRFECSLTLIGSAIHQLSAYLAAAAIFFAGVGGELAGAEALTQGGGRVSIASQGAAWSLPVLSVSDATGAPLSPDRLVLDFLTPVRLLHDGALLRSIDFPALARPLMRRVSALAGYYGAGELDLDYRWLSARAAAVSTDPSGCRFAQWGRKVAGVLGPVVFRGNLEPFHALLLAGEILHLGKGASFGQGAFHIVR